MIVVCDEISTIMYAWSDGKIDIAFKAHGLAMLSLVELEQVIDDIQKLVKEEEIVFYFTLWVRQLSPNIIKAFRLMFKLYKIKVIELTIKQKQEFETAAILFEANKHSIQPQYYLDLDNKNVQLFNFQTKKSQFSKIELCEEHRTLAGKASLYVAALNAFEKFSTISGSIIGSSAFCDLAIWCELPIGKKLLINEIIETFKKKLENMNDNQWQNYINVVYVLTLLVSKATKSTSIYICSDPVTVSWISGWFIKHQKIMTWHHSLKILNDERKQKLSKLPKVRENDVWHILYPENKKKWIYLSKINNNRLITLYNIYRETGQNRKALVALYSCWMVIFNPNNDDRKWLLKFTSQQEIDTLWINIDKNPNKYHIMIQNTSDTKMCQVLSLKNLKGNRRESYENYQHHSENGITDYYDVQTKSPTLEFDPSIYCIVRLDDLIGEQLIGQLSDHILDTMNRENKRHIYYYQDGNFKNIDTNKKTSICKSPINFVNFDPFIDFIDLKSFELWRWKYEDQVIDIPNRCMQETDSINTPIKLAIVKKCDLNPINMLISHWNTNLPYLTPCEIEKAWKDANYEILQGDTITKNVQQQLLNKFTQILELKNDSFQKNFLLEKIKELAAKGKVENVITIYIMLRELLICPIMQTAFENPIFTNNGHTFELGVIEYNNGVCPFTRLSDTTYKDNILIRRVMQILQDFQ